MYSVYQHWDPLKVCIVGRSYPPEFYSWIKKPAVRSLFEKIAIETEEDFQNIIKKLESFNVEILRPELPNTLFFSDQYVRPPMTPRDYTVMVGETFYTNYGWGEVPFAQFYNDVKDPSWPICNTIDDFNQLPTRIQHECTTLHNMSLGWNCRADFGCYSKIYSYIVSKGNQIKHGIADRVNGSMISRIGKDLFFGTHDYAENNSKFIDLANKEFNQTRNHVVNTGGHGDSTYCPVCPGLIISLYDVPTYVDTFPDWEVVYLPNQSWSKVNEFLKLKEKNSGKWWIPGFEQDQDVVDTVERWLGHWTGYVEETVFDVNMLIIDPKNVIVFNYNKQVFDALDRYGITPHIVPFRHRYFWDGGIHCVTSDLHREGTMQDYFPGRT